MVRNLQIALAELLSLLDMFYPYSLFKWLRKEYKTTDLIELLKILGLMMVGFGFYLIGSGYGL